MAFITYTAPHGDEREVEYMGIALVHGVPVRVTDAHIVRKAMGNPHFTVKAVQAVEPAYAVEPESPLAVIEPPKRRTWSRRPKAENAKISA